ncbi:unnamed protein product, partial [Phaeothamnion confervicola]
PVTDFNFTFGSACLGDVIQFNNEGIEAYTHTWYINDAVVSHTYNLQHAFTEYGSYYITLETSNNGVTTSHSETIGFAPPVSSYPPITIWPGLSTCSEVGFYLYIKNPQYDLNYELWFEGHPLLS